MDETDEQRKRRLALESECAAIGRILASGMPKGVGFALVMFDFGGKGNMAYMSNGNREGLIKLFGELREKLMETSQ